MFRELTIPCSRFNVIVQADLDSADYMRIYYEIFKHIQQYGEMYSSSEWLVVGGILAKIENSKSVVQYVITDDPAGYTGPGSTEPLWLYVMWRNSAPADWDCLILTAYGAELLLKALSGNGIAQ